VRSPLRVSPGAFWSLLRRLPRGFSAGIAIEGQFLRAVLEQVFSGLYAPPALRVRATRRPLEILSGEAVASLQLVKREARRLLAPATVGSGFCISLRRYIRLPVFGELSADPVPGLRTFSFREDTLEVSEGPRELETPLPDDAVRVLGVEPPVLERR